MAAPRRAVELSIGSDDSARLELIARSRTQPAMRVDRARMFLAYNADLSSVAVRERIGVVRYTVRRCVRRAEPWASLRRSKEVRDPARHL